MPLLSQPQNSTGFVAKPGAKSRLISCGSYVRAQARGASYAGRRVGVRAPESQRLSNPSPGPKKFCGPPQNTACCLGCEKKSRVGVLADNALAHAGCGMDSPKPDCQADECVVAYSGVLPGGGLPPARTHFFSRRAPVSPFHRHPAEPRNVIKFPVFCRAAWHLPARILSPPAGRLTAAGQRTGQKGGRNVYTH